RRAWAICVERDFAYWYHAAGPITEPTFGVGASGRAYSFQAGERVVSRRGDSQLDRVIAKLDRLVRAAEQSPGLTGRTSAEALNRSTRLVSYAGYYGS